MISIVIITLNSEKHIRSCLRSIFSQDCRALEVIVVDNGSKDGTVDFIKSAFSMVTLIQNRENLGAAKARNQGIKISSGKWILTLDCDTVLQEEFIAELLRAISEVPHDIGMLEPKTFNHDNSVLYSCGIYLSPLRRFYDIGRGEIDNGKFERPRYIFGASSVCGLYRRKMLEDIKEKTGYFDERFFFLVEDVDLAWRAKRKGWRAVFYPRLSCHHYSNSCDFSKKLRQYFCFRNRYYMMIKNEGLKRFYLNLAFLFLYDFPRLAYMLLTNPYTIKALREVRSFIRGEEIASSPRADCNDMRGKL